MVVRGARLGRARREGADTIEIGPRKGSGSAVPTLVFNVSTDARRGKLPLHLDVNATDRDQDAELEGCSSPAGGRRSDRSSMRDRVLGRAGRLRGQRVLPPRRRVEPV